MICQQIYFLNDLSHSRVRYLSLFNYDSLLYDYHISSYSLTLCTVTFGNSTYRCGNYSREETIQGRKLFAEIRYPSKELCSKKALGEVGLSLP